MRLTTLTLAASLMATPLAADTMLDRVRDWLSTRVEGCGLACTTPGIRRAEGIPPGLRQNRTGWVNTGDAKVIDSVRVAPPHGIQVLNWSLKDAQDEGSTRLQVFNFEGEKIYDKMYAYKGNKANGDVVRGRLDARDFGRSGWRGLSARLTMTGDGDPREDDDFNGVTFRFNYRADPTCQQAAIPNRANSAGRAAPDYTADRRAERKADNRQDRREANRDRRGNAKGKRK
jgi:hypothetical protein